MRVKQISIFIENREGTLCGVCDVLAKNGVNLKAMSLADTQEYGILRIIVEDAELAMDILRDAGYVCKSTYVIAVGIEDTPGGMASALRRITDAGIEIEYAYAFISHKEGSAAMVFRMRHSKAAEEKLSATGLKLLTHEELFG